MTVNDAVITEVYVWPRK